MIAYNVLMYWEKPIGKWVRPYLVAYRKGKILTINTGDRHLSSSVDKVKLYIERNTTNPVFGGKGHSDKVAA